MKKITNIEIKNFRAFFDRYNIELNNGENLQTAAQLAILISSEVVSKFGPRLDVAEYANLLETFKKECA